MKNMTKSQFTSLIKEIATNKKITELFGSDENSQLKQAKKKAVQASIDAKTLEVNAEKKSLSNIR